MKAKEAAATGKPNSVTKELIASRIVETQYKVTEVFGKRFMHCYIMMDNGFVQVGKPSVCVDDDNFNQEDGELISFENAVEELWKLEAYRMMSDNHSEPYAPTTLINDENSEAQGLTKALVKCCKCGSDNLRSEEDLARMAMVTGCLDCGALQE